MGNRFKHKTEGEQTGREVGKIAGAYPPFENSEIREPSKRHKQKLL